MIDKLIEIAFFGIAAIAIAMTMAATLDNVGIVQLNIAYRCAIEYTPTQRVKYCRNDLDGFGNLVDLSRYRY